MFYYFGLENAVRKLFTDQQFCELRGGDRGCDKPDDFYGAAYARRINDQTNGELFRRQNSAYDIGFDFGQIFAFKQHSTGLQCLRCVLISTLLGLANTLFVRV